MAEPDVILRKLCAKIATIGVASREDLTDEEWTLYNPDAKIPKKKKEKKVKDPNEPKKAKTAYQFFCDTMRVQLKEKSPEMAFAEIMKKMGEDWKALSAEEKKPYEKLNAEAKVKYAEAMKEFKSE
jgi:hypothetical protein